MTNSKTTKRAFFSSVVALLLCFTMLLGATFAWFTDSAASGSNVITAGNLDIEVQYTLDGENWNDLDGATALFQKGLWEPGHTEVVALRIKNNGTLALKYAANMNIVNETVGKNKDGADIVLSDILTVSTGIYGVTDEVDPFLGFNISEKTLESAFANESTLVLTNNASFKNSSVLGSDKKLMPKETHYLIVRVDMAETVGNDANHNGINIPEINFGINVLATQFTYENDSFGNQYDEDATYPAISIEKLEGDRADAVNVDSGNSLTMDMNDHAINNNVTSSGNIVLENGTINATKADVSENSAGFESNGGFAELNNVTVNAGDANDYAVVLRSSTAMTNVMVNSEGGGIGVAGGAKAVFNSGSVYVDTASTSGRYIFYVEGNGSELTINGGNFSWDPADNQKRAYVYAFEGTTVNITGGEFGKASTRSGYTAGILGNGTVIITGGTFGFDPSEWVAEGYEAVKNGTTWTVSEK